MTKPRAFTVSIGTQELTAHAFVTGKFRPGVYSGPPERCYEAESPEVDIDRLTIRDTDVTGLIDDECVRESIYEQILDQLDEEQRAGPDPDDARDEQIDR